MNWTLITVVCLRQNADCYFTFTKHSKTGSNQNLSNLKRNFGSKQLRLIQTQGSSLDQIPPLPHSKAENGHSDRSAYSVHQPTTKEVL